MVSEGLICLFALLVWVMYTDRSDKRERDERRDRDERNKK